MIYNGLKIFLAVGTIFNGRQFGVTGVTGAELPVISILPVRKDVNLNAVDLYMDEAVRTVLQNYEGNCSLIRSNSEDPNSLEFNICVEISELNYTVLPRLDGFLQNPLAIKAEFCNSDIFDKSVAVILVDSAEEISNDSKKTAKQKPTRSHYSWPSIVAYALGCYKTPILSTHSRSSEFSNEVLYPSFVRLSPSWVDQGDVLVSLVCEFSYKKIIVICSDDINGVAIQNRIESLADSRDIEIVLSYTPEEFDEKYESEADRIDATVFVVHCRSEQMDKIVDTAERLGLFEQGYVWILSEKAFMNRTSPSGLIGVSSIEDNREEPLKLAFTLLLDSIVQLYRKDGINAIRPRANLFCDTAQDVVTDQAQLGFNLFNEIISEKRLKYGKMFGENGDVIATYEISNTWNNVTRAVIGETKYSHDSQRMVFERGGLRHFRFLNDGSNTTSTQPLGTKLPTDLIIVTVIDEPMVYGGFHQYAGNCSQVPTNRTTEYEHAPFHDCLDFRSGRNGSLACCGGYSIAVVMSMSKFRSTIHLIDRSYAPKKLKLKKTDKAGAGINGVVAYLYDKKAHVAAATLTLRNDYQDYIEISEPYDFHGMHILQHKISRGSPLESFMQPFDWLLWLSIFCSVIVIAFSLYFLDRLSPFRIDESEAIDDEVETTLNMTSAFWFAWGVILDSGIGEKSPRSFSARMLGMVWCGFVMIIVSSYTANLAAFLVLDQPVRALSGLDDSRLRNPSANFSYGTVKDSGILQFFKLRAELSTMYRAMDRHNVYSSDEGVAKVKNGTLQAFIWESRKIEFEVAQDTDCVLIKSVNPFGRSAYVFGFPQGSLVKDEINAAIMEMHESEVTATHMRYWTVPGIKTCKAKNEVIGPRSLKLDIMKDLFILIGCGIAAGMVLIVLECKLTQSEEEVFRRSSVVKAARIWKDRALSYESSQRSKRSLNSMQTTSSDNLDNNTYLPQLKDISELGNYTQGWGTRGSAKKPESAYSYVPLDRKMVVDSLVVKDEDENGFHTAAAGPRTKFIRLTEGASYV